MTDREAQIEALWTYEISMARKQSHKVYFKINVKL